MWPMLTVIIGGLGSAINFAVYALVGQTINLAAGIFCGIMALYGLALVARD